MSSRQALARVISVCSAKDLQAWSVACQKILDHIQARQYLIIVPDAEVGLFRVVTPLPYLVVPESIYVGNLKDQLKKLLPPENHDRIGWYLQQFIKIAAAKEIESDMNPSELVLIWDADTVPLKDLNFMDSEGRVLYYQGSEFHQPYFAFIEKAFGFSRAHNFSFIAQCFPAKIAWVNEFCNALESFERNWIEAIVEKLDSTQRAGFSEYESLGAYIWNKYPQEVALNPGRWERNGRSLVGRPDKLSAMQWLGLSQLFDYISFEAWDVSKGLRASFRAMRNCLRFGALGRKQVNKLVEII
jgi:Family of unknown function (DUF6492)